MASSKKKAEIRKAPKHLDKMLFINYKEEERLQQKLKDLTNNSRLRGLELDREKVHVHNEMRLSKRRNSNPVTTPLLSRPATKSTPISRPSTRDVPGRPSDRRRASNADPVNEYLLTEFKRVSEVIPSILSSLNKDDNPGEDEGQGPAGGGVGRKVRRATVAGHEGSAVSSLATPQVRLDPDLKAFASKKADQSPDDPSIGNIVSMIRSIKTLREDMAAKKRYGVTRAKISFNELLKNIHEEDRRGSESDTYTDGVCVLLRRKMHKARRASCPALDLSPVQPGGQVTTPHSTGGTAPQQRRLSRCSTNLASVGRQNSRDSDGFMHAMLQEEDRQLTELKVATEWRRYDDIRTRIDHFLHDVKGSQRRCSLPVLSGMGNIEKEETTNNHD